MKKQSLKFGITEDAKFPTKFRDIPTVTRYPSLWERYGQHAYAAIMYGLVVAGVGVATYAMVTPAHSAGSMASEVRVIHVSPSIQSFEDTREGRRLKADTVRDNNRHRQDMERLERRYELERALEADRAYYRKLIDQRKRK